MRHALFLAASIGIASCGDSVQVSPSVGVAPSEGSDPTMVATGSASRQGPFRVTCYKDEAIVFEHGTIYRVYQPDGVDAGWSYETGDGLKFRGRIGENVNCVWQSR